MRALLRYSCAEYRLREPRRSSSQSSLNLRPVLRTSTDTHISHSCESLVVTFVTVERANSSTWARAHNVRNVPGKGPRDRQTGGCKEEKDSPFFFSSQRERPPERARTNQRCTNDVIPPFCHEPWRLNTNCRCFLFPFVIYTRSGRIARDVQAGSDGQRQGLPTLVANGGGTD